MYILQSRLMLNKNYIYIAGSYYFFLGAVVVLIVW